ncbi:fasciclin domain-containing protein [Flavobacterium dankookense]|uniref:Putative surface protein with fasciclin (FAS1) repeats n=1 Tax=Flavobacterium dankookense TaxID=706186 RepID=A0A4R6Q7U2_9FLAO|nr:fasciclin domain-containing protein [Flavobacterium dankookense]TDP57886.1 putative surface protein with fasciclin (FAS1) repeats [Flavobacterium dankookense]
MKNLIKKMAIATIALTMFSCSDDDNNSTPVDNTVTGLALRTPDLSLLVKALTKAGLADDLQTAGPFTVFAPTNQAFIDAGYTAAAIDDLTDAEIPALRELLLNHVVSGAVQSSGLTDDSYIKTLGKGAASATNTLSMFVDTTGGVTLNGSSSVITTTNGTTFNIIASNGVIHLVDEVITLPTIVDHALANDNFTDLVGLLSAQGLVPTLDGTVSSPFTVFAPINSAFTPAVEGVYGSLTSDNKTNLLKYHVVGGVNVLSNAIPTGQIGTLFTGNSFSITGVSIDDASATNKTIIVKDVQCSNGIIHAVDGVLIPAFN